MTTTTRLTFEKNLSPAVTVRIENIPGRIGSGGERDARRQFVDRETAIRLEELMDVARSRMAAGETEIRLDFADDV